MLNIKDENTKILVTGSSGFIGSVIVEQLNQSGYQVVLSTRDKSKAVKDNVILIDLLKPETIIGLSNKYSFDVIVHFGAAIGWTDENEKTMLLSNVVATSLLSHEAEKMGAKFIFASAAIVHGAHTENIDIESEINPDTAYAKSKWLAEELIRMSGGNYCILRIGGVFGLYGPKHLGLNNAISEVIEAITPKVYGNGNAKRNYIYVWDVAKAVEVIIKKNIIGTQLLAGTEQSTIGTMIEQVCKTLSDDIFPNKQPGNKATHQIIEPSDVLPKTRSFENSIGDIKVKLNAL